MNSEFVIYVLKRPAVALADQITGRARETRISVIQTVDSKVEKIFSFTHGITNTVM